MIKLKKALTHAILGTTGCLAYIVVMVACLIIVIDFLKAGLVWAVFVELISIIFAVLLFVFYFFED